VTDAWPGIETFLTPETEILPVSTARELVERLRTVDWTRAAEIGAAARRRVIRDHTYAGRAQTLEAALAQTRARGSA
jgi:spore maturation protein CgeB